MFSISCFWLSDVFKPVIAAQFISVRSRVRWRFHKVKLSCFEFLWINQGGTRITGTVLPARRVHP